MVELPIDETMKKLDIKKLDTPNRIIEIVTYGVVLKWFEQQGATVKEENISKYSDFVSITSDKGIYKHDCFYGDYDPVRRDYRDVGIIKINANDGIYSEDRWTDTIFYTVERINGNTNDNENVKINILEGEKEPSIRRTKVTSELGKLILDTLKERFTEREEQEAEKNAQEVNDLEQETIEFVLERGGDCRTLERALMRMLSKESDKTNAEQHLVNAMEAQNRGTDQAQYQGS